MSRPRRSSDAVALAVGVYSVVLEWTQRTVLAYKPICQQTYACWIYTHMAWCSACHLYHSHVSIVHEVWISQELSILLSRTKGHCSCLDRCWVQAIYWSLMTKITILLVSLLHTLSFPPSACDDENITTFAVFTRAPVRNPMSCWSIPWGPILPWMSEQAHTE